MIEPKKNIKDLFRATAAFDNRIGKIVRLDRNERTTPFSEEHLKKILNDITPEEIVGYPELEPFYNKLANWLGIEREQILLVSGSDTGIRAVYETYLEEGDEVIMLSPTYGMYAVYCKMFGAISKEIFYDFDFSLLLEKILRAINQKTKLIAIANPNHTGTVISGPDLIKIIETAGNCGSLVLVDEAYYHFYDHTMLHNISEFDNLILVRTFSKAFGIASLRIGYLMSNKSVIEQLYKVKLTHEITGISARFGEYLLDHLDIMENYVIDVKSGINYLENEFRNLGLHTPKTHANFIYAELPEGFNGKMLIELLKKDGFYISGPFAKIPFKNHIRITVGPVAQMKEFIRIFKIVYNKVELEK